MFARGSASFHLPHYRASIPKSPNSNHSLTYARLARKSNHSLTYAKTGGGVGIYRSLGQTTPATPFFPTLARPQHNLLLFNTLQTPGVGVLRADRPTPCPSSGHGTRITSVLSTHSSSLRYLFLFLRPPLATRLPRANPRGHFPSIPILTRRASYLPPFIPPTR